MNRLKMLLRKRALVIVIVSVVIALLTFLIAVNLTPWFNAINTRVRLYLTTSEETKVSICWDKHQRQCLPLVPYSSAKSRIPQAGEMADVWMGELPPRPKYDISLIFNSPVKNAVFNRLELDSSQVLLFGYSDQVGIRNLSFPIKQFTTEGISQKSGNGIPYFSGNSGSNFKLSTELIPGPAGDSKNGITLLTVWGLLFSIYIFIAIPVFLLPELIAHSGTAMQIAREEMYPWWFYLLGGAASIVMPLLVLNSGVIFIEYDPMGYLYLAIGGGWFSDARLPGYPFFLGLALKIFQNNLNGVVFLQAICLVVSIFLCMWILRKWIPPFVAILTILFCLFSPAQIHWARWILRESIFASLVLLGITTVIAHFSSRKPISTIWLFIFSIICGIAFLVRENGILLPVALLPVLIPQAIKYLISSNSIWWKIKTISSLGIRYMPPIVVIGVIYIGFSFYNYQHYGYFQVGLHQTSHDFLAKTLYPANSDSRSLLDTNTDGKNNEVQYYKGWALYSSYILTRDQYPSLDPVYASLYPTISQIMAKRGEAINSFHIGSILNEIGRDINKLVSWQANVSGILRQYREVVSLNNNGYSYPLQVVDPSTIPHIQTLLDQLPVKIHITLDEKIIPPNNIIYQYYQATLNYKWYPVLLILALFSSAYIVKYGDSVFLGPITFFITNSALLIYTRLVSYRYLVSLDVLLVFQIAFGLSYWIRRNKDARRTQLIAWVRTIFVRKGSIKQ